MATIDCITIQAIRNVGEIRSVRTKPVTTTLTSAQIPNKSACARDNPTGVDARFAHGSSCRQHGQIFPKIDLWLELVNRGLARDDLTGWRAARQPRCQRFFADFRACRGQQLKQRSGAEEIEVSREGVAFQKAGAVRAGTGPLEIQPGHSPLVQLPGSAGFVNTIEHARVQDHQYAERAKDDDRPYSGHAITHEGLPAQDREDRGNDQPRVREAKRCATAASDLAGPPLDAA
jgi:hypothetical protein